MELTERLEIAKRQRGRWFSRRIQAEMALDEANDMMAVLDADIETLKAQIEKPHCPLEDLAKAEETPNES